MSFSRLFSFGRKYILRTLALRLAFENLDRGPLPKPNPKFSRSVWFPWKFNNIRCYLNFTSHEYSLLSDRPTPSGILVTFFPKPILSSPRGLGDLFAEGRPVRGRSLVLKKQYTSSCIEPVEVARMISRSPRFAGRLSSSLRRRVELDYPLA